MSKKVKSRTWAAVLVVLIAAVLVIVGYFVYQYLQADDIEDDIDIIRQEVVIEPEVEEDDSDEESGVDKYLRRKIDFDSLQTTNSDVATWVFIPDTNIDSYVMQEQTLNKYYYDHKNIYKRYVYSGSYLMPKEPLEDIEDAHQLIFGHNMGNGLQFGRLKRYYANKSVGSSHEYVYTYYPDHSQRWKVWTICDVKEDDMIYELPYEFGTERYKDLLDHAESKGRYQLCDKPDEYTKTLMLSTCNRWNYYILARIVVVCVPDVAYYYNEDKEVTYEEQKLVQEESLAYE